MSERPEQTAASNLPTPRQAWREVWTSEPFGVVLLLVFATFVFIEAAPEKEWTSIITIGLLGATLLMAMRAAGNRARYQRAARVVVAVGLVASIVSVVGVDAQVSKAFVRGVSALLVAVTPFTIARSVFHSVLDQRRVTLQAIFGVVAIYLMLGILFAYAYAVIGAIADDPFFTSGASETIQNFVYFSFVTVTTVGFGDLTAAHQLGRTLAIVEALFGQLYLILVVSLFVGNLRTRSAQR